MRLRNRVPAALALVLTTTLVTSAPARAAAPERIDLPNGFQPEGIAISGPIAYFGSLADGSIYAADLRTGEGRRLRPGPGVPAVGLKARGTKLYVAGGPSGTARVVDKRTGRVLSTLRLARDESFVNDVVIARGAAWFTDSTSPRLWRVPLGADGVPRTSDVQTLRLRGEWRQPEPGEFGANGISRTPDGTALLVVESTGGKLYRVPMRGARTGVAERVRVSGVRLVNGDGMLQPSGSDVLHVVLNRRNKVAVLRLDDAGRTASKRGFLTSPDFDVPTTIAVWRDQAYLPNARFTTPPKPGTRYSAYGVPLP
jgi:sugar lactone lactonase YvrE